MSDDEPDVGLESDVSNHYDVLYQDMFVYVRFCLTGGE